MINKMIVSYKSKQMPIITLSSTESEFVAFALSLREIRWICGSLLELDAVFDLCIIYTDNQGDIKIIKNEAAVGRTKHVDIKLQYLKLAILNNEVELRYVNALDNVSNIFTKPVVIVFFIIR